MFPFVFFVSILLFSSNVKAWSDDELGEVDDPDCDELRPIFSSSETEVHAMLARDRYIDFTGYDAKIQNIDDITELNGTQKISFGYLKEMIVQFGLTPKGKENGRIKARIFLTSQDQIIFRYDFTTCVCSYVHDNFIDRCPKVREQISKIKLFYNGITVERISITPEGHQFGPCTPQGQPICHRYPEGFPRIGEYPKIDGLLIQIDCETTIVKKILVKCHPE